MKALLGLLAWGLCVVPVVGQERPEQPPPRKMVETQPTASALDFTMKDIDGKDVPLAKYKGQPVLLVNVASQCGFTPQYGDLEALYKKYAERGLRVLGFPANNFRQQEPGTNAEIKEFCQKNYGVTFDMFGKVSVKGDDMCALYQFLTSKEKNPQFGGDIQWNFTKFLVGRDGRVMARFEPKVKPDDPAVIEAVETALSAKPATEKGGQEKPARADEPKKP